MRTAMTALRVLMTPVVLVAVVASCLFAFEFGWGRGATPIHHWAFGMLAAGLDLFKVVCPMIAAYYFHVGLKAQARSAWLAFGFLTIMSLFCAWGTNANQLAERIASRATVVSEKALKDGTLVRLQADRTKLPDFVPTTQDVVDAAKSSVDGAIAQTAAECDKRGPNCRNREADERTARAALGVAQANKAATDVAVALDIKIAAAEAALATVDNAAIAKDADPQIASIAKLTGWSEDAIGLVANILFAIAVEVGSGLGPWLIWGHGGSAKKREPDDEATPEPETKDDKTPSDSLKTIRRQFFDEHLHHAPGNNLAAGVVHGAYLKYCRQNGHVPMDAHAFGRGSPWTKRKKIGGISHYLDCALSVSLVGAQGLKVVASNG